MIIIFNTAYVLEMLIICRIRLSIIEAVFITVFVIITDEL